MSWGPCEQCSESEADMHDIEPYDTQDGVVWLCVTCGEAYDHDEEPAEDGDAEAGRTYWNRTWNDERQGELSFG